MSLRQIRKLERQKLENSLTPEVEDVEEDIDVSPVSEPKKTFNAFNFLEESEEEEYEQQQQETEIPVEKEAEEVVVDTKPKKKSKKKKNKKKKQQVEEKEDSDAELDKILAEAQKRDNLTSKQPTKEASAEVSDSEEDFEAEYNENTKPELEYDSNYKNFTAERLRQSIPLLSIQTIKNLDSDEELKLLFGELSLETIQDANSTTSLATTPDVLKQIKRLARLTKGWGGKDKRSVPGTTGKLLLTRIKDDYIPTQQKPVQMDELNDTEVFELLDSKETTIQPSEIEKKIKKEKKLGVKYFRFKKVNTVQERVANTQFYASVVIAPDHDSLFALLRSCPYHAETLLQVSKVLLRQGSDKSTSNALIEKCLFVFDRSFHKYFHDLLAEGKNGLLRLPYESFMNRQFYICLFRFIGNLGERATFFTSFSYCKLLLSLSPAEDPLGVRYFIDYYALKSGEYKYLINLCESPLVTSYTRWFTPGIAFSTVLAYLALDDKEGAKTQLQKAFTAHPYTSLQMLKEIGLSSNVPVTEADIFVNDEILLANETYMIRAKGLWDSTEARKFLSDELHILFTTNAAALKGESSGIVASVQKFFFPTKPNHTISAEIPVNLLRFAILSEENKIMAKVPESVWSRDDVYEFDPLPPTNDAIGYDAISGVNTSKLVDRALDYVDQNLLAQIIQNNTQNDEFDDIVRQLQEE